MISFAIGVFVAMAVSRLMDGVGRGPWSPGAL
jgi:hypothetical protein